MDPYRSRAPPQRTRAVLGRFFQDLLNSLHLFEFGEGTRVILSSKHGALQVADLSFRKAKTEGAMAPVDTSLRRELAALRFATVTCTPRRTQTKCCSVPLTAPPGEPGVLDTFS